MNSSKLYSIFCENKTVCTDSRKLRKNDLFFALKGPNFDGNLYAEDVLHSGARAAVVDDKKLRGIPNCILVDNVLVALQQLALHHRRSVKTKIIALTGSNGKTTTKELIKAVLSTKYYTYATKGNLNNHIGIPLSLLEIEPLHEIAVIEMGANHPKEIESYCTYTEPDYGLITNIGQAHLEGFGDIMGVLSAKSELFDHLKIHNKLIFLNTDDKLLNDKWHDYKPSLRFGMDDKSDVIGGYEARGPYAGLHWKVRETEKQYDCTSRLTGAYNFQNLLAAVSIGTYFEVPVESIIEAIENHEPDKLRSRVINTSSNKVVLDTYNANPSSMKEALKNMQVSFGNNLIFILGDMNELGANSGDLHSEILSLAISLNPEHIYLVGNNYSKLNSERVSYYSDVVALNQHFQKKKIENVNILVKGSRSVGLEKVLEVL